VAVQPLALRLTFFLLFAGLNIIAVSNLAAAVADVVPAEVRGSGFAIVQFVLTIGSAFGPAIIGICSALAGDDLRVGFAALIVPLLLGCFVVWRAKATYLKDLESTIAAAADGPA
jgi:MFS-type transporter involved in bile tolerance (Atg22 family)